MPRLWLVFKDERGEEKRVEVDHTPFTIGRHSECDLTILDGRLSREHLRIEWQTDKFVALDTGSSNGTTLNGGELTETVRLNNADALNLGGGIEVQVVLEEAEPGDPAAPPTPPPAAADAPPPDPAVPESPSGVAASVNGPASVPVAPSGPDGGIPTAFFIIAPLLGVFVLVAVIGAVVLFGGEDKKQVASDRDNYEYSGDDGDTSAGNKDEGGKATPVKSATPLVSGTPANGGPIGTSSPTPGGTGLPPMGGMSETAKVERNGAVFLRNAAQKDDNAFLTSEQSATVLKRIGKSAALADNINSARRNAAAIKSLAASKNLKPQFLAVAAITKLGASRGDVLQAAQSVAEVYDKLAIHLGNENSDDVLLMVAAYDQGAAGEFRKMRDLLQQLAKNAGAPGPRELRSIWYLEKTGNIARADYERALNFLAIGTIAQNPKEFGVNAEALSL